MVQILVRCKAGSEWRWDEMVRKGRKSAPERYEAAMTVSGPSYYV